LRKQLVCAFVIDNSTVLHDLRSKHDLSDASNQQFLWLVGSFRPLSFALAKRKSSFVMNSVSKIRYQPIHDISDVIEQVCGRGSV
jgi:hypothetical protein